MRFTCKTFRKNRSRRQNAKAKAKATLKKKVQKGGSLYRNIPKEAIIVNPLQWDN
jgi:transposase-like protein